MRLEARQIGSHRALDVTHTARRLLDQRAGLNVDVQLHPREARAKLVEGHDAGVSDALDDLPLDALVRALLDDLGLELLRLAPDLDLEGDVRLVLLRHVLQPVHELRPLLELGPLVVDGLEGNADVDVLLDRHAPALADSFDALRLAAAASAAGQDPLACLLGEATGAAGLLHRVANGLLHASADLLADLLHGPTAVRGKPAHELARAFGRQGSECDE